MRSLLWQRLLFPLTKSSKTSPLNNRGRLYEGNRLVITGSKFLAVEGTAAKSRRSDPCKAKTMRSLYSGSRTEFQ